MTRKQNIDRMEEMGTSRTGRTDKTRRTMVNSTDRTTHRLKMAMALGHHHLEFLMEKTCRTP
jgi:hypothetical protein